MIFVFHFFKINLDMLINLFLTDHIQTIKMYNVIYFTFVIHISIQGNFLRKTYISKLNRLIGPMSWTYFPCSYSIIKPFTRLTIQSEHLVSQLLVLTSDYSFSMINVGFFLIILVFLPFVRLNFHWFLLIAYLNVCVIFILFRYGKIIISFSVVHLEKAKERCIFFLILNQQTFRRLLLFVLFTFCFYRISWLFLELKLVYRPKIGNFWFLFLYCRLF